MSTAFTTLCSLGLIGPMTLAGFGAHDGANPKSSPAAPTTSSTTAVPRRSSRARRRTACSLSR